MEKLFIGLFLCLILIIFIWTLRYKNKQKKEFQKEKLIEEVLSAPDDFGKIKLETSDSNAPLAMNIVEEVKTENHFNGGVDPYLSEEEKQFIEQYNNEMNQN